MKLRKLMQSAVSIICASAMCAALVPAAFAKDFVDVADTASYKTAFDELYALGIVSGYEDGTIRPENNITRAEVTKLVVAAMGPSYTEAAVGATGVNTQFYDVPGSHWASGYISTGVANGFINGNGDGTFTPENNVTYAEIVKMIVCAMGYGAISERNGGWPNGYLTTGANIGVTSGANVVGADTVVTRGQVAILLNNALNIPIVGVTGYEENAYTGTLIAKTDILDEITSGGNAKDYQTLLTQNHNTYKVKGRFIATKRSDNSLDENEVTFKVESANNFDGYAYGRSYLDPEPVNMIYNGGDAGEKLFIYGDAVIYVNSDYEYEILSFTPYGSNDTTVVDTELFYEYSKSGSTLESITMYKDASSSKTDKYKLDSNADVYVNGVKLDNKLSAIDNYLVNNQMGTVAFVDATEEGKSTTDGKYDYVIINYYVDAIVDSYVESNSTLKVYFKDNDSKIKGNMKVDLDDDDISLTFTYKNGDYSYTDIQENDVFSIAYDVTNSFDKSAFYDIYVSRDVVDGRVDRSITDSLNRTQYEINDTYYTLSQSLSSVLEVGTYYTLYFNTFGKIVKTDETSSNSLIGIIERVYEGDDGDYYVKLINSSGSKITYKTRDKSAYNNIKAVFDAMEGKLEDRIAKYIVNSSGLITSITKVSAVRVDNASYRASSNKLNSYSLSQYTNVIDLTYSDNDVDTKNGISTVKKVSVDSFVDSGEYGVVLADRSSSDGSYRYAFVFSGSETYTGNTMIAVMVDSILEYDDYQGETVRVLNVYTDGGYSTKQLRVDVSCTTTLNTGDVFVYNTDSDGYVDEIIRIFDKISASGGDYERFLKSVMVSDYTERNDCSLYASFLNMPNGWLTSTAATKTGKVDVIFAPVINKYSNSVTLGVLNNQLQSPELTHQVDYSIPDDANVYIYDFSYKQPAYQLSRGSVGSVRKTNIPESCKLYEGTERTNIDWTLVDASGNSINFLVGKVVDGDITEALVILGDKTVDTGTSAMVKRYAVTAENCSVSSSVAKPGDTITVSYETPAGKELAGIYMGNAADTSSLTQITGTTFTMPSYDVYVKAEFVDAEYSITMIDQNEENGSVVTKVNDTVVTTAKAGETVTVEYTSKVGKNVTITVNGTVIEGNTFVMPAQNTTVKVEFTDCVYTLTSETATFKVNNVQVTSAKAGDLVTVEYVLPENQTFEGIYVNGIKIEENTFTMPSENVTVVVNFTESPLSITAVGCTTSVVSAVTGNIVTVIYNAPENQELDKITVNGNEIQGTTFTMPDTNVTVIATYKEKTYSLTAANCTLSAASAKAGEIITVTPNAAAERTEFIGIVVNSTMITGNTFEMPANDTRVEAVYSQKSYTITTQNCTADKHTAKAGETVTLTATADKGKEIDKFYVNGAAISGRSFTMPEADVTVTVTFIDEVYDINTENCTTDKASAKMGEIITVSYSVPAGKKFEYITVNGETLSGNTFEMPAGAVTVKAVYTDVLYTVTAEGCTVNKTLAASGDEILVTYNPPAGKKVDKVVIDGKRVAKVEKSFIMPAANTTISVTYTDITYPVTAIDCKVDKTYAKAGEDVTVTWTVPANSELESIMINGKPQSSIDAKKSSFVFKMTSENITVVATFKTVTTQTDTTTQTEQITQTGQTTSTIQSQTKSLSVK